MTAKQRAYRLRALVDAHQLSHADIEHITGATRRTIRHWLVDPDCDDYRSPSEAAVRLIEIHTGGNAR